MSRTTSKERGEVIARLIQLGISYDDAEALRRVAMTLRRWYEMECGTENAAGSSISIEREGGTDDGKPFQRVQYRGARNEWVDRKFPIADREAGAKKRLAAIMATYKRRLVPFLQTDPRGASLYILRKGKDIQKGDDISSIYTRGVAVY